MASNAVKKFLNKKEKRSGTDVTDHPTASSDASKANRSKSLGDIMENDNKVEGAVCFSQTHEEWKDLGLIKTMSPVIMCVLPSTAKDIVASVLLAIGAYPIMPEEKEDVECQLAAAQAILLDTSAKRDIVEAIIERHTDDIAPIVLVCWESGTSDVRKNLTRKVAEVCKPTVISGRLGDVHALSLDIMDRAEGIIDDQDDVNGEQRSKSSSPEDPPSNNSTSRGTLGAAVSVDRASSPRFMRKAAAKPIYQRQQTAIPQLVLKGQFRHQSIKDVSIPVAFKSAQKLGAQLGCYVHLHETSVVTCGEFFYEVNNIQIGMERIHHTLQSAAAIMAATIACVEQQEDEGTTLMTCGHALSLYHVAAEDAADLVSSANKGMVHPGSLKVAFIDALNKLDEIQVQLKAQTVFHNAPPK